MARKPKKNRKQSRNIPAGASVTTDSAFQGSGEDEFDLVMRKLIHVKKSELDNEIEKHAAPKRRGR